MKFVFQHCCWHLQEKSQSAANNNYSCIETLKSVCARMETGLRPEHMRALAYLLLNVLSGTGIVFANKLVLSVLRFHYVRPCKLRCACLCSILTAACMKFVVTMFLLGEFDLAHLQVYALTFLHSVVTMFGMWTFAAVGMFEPKVLAARQVRALCPLVDASFGMPLA